MSKTHLAITILREKRGELEVKLNALLNAHKLIPNGPGSDYMIAKNQIMNEVKIWQQQENELVLCIRLLSNSDLLMMLDKLSDQCPGILKKEEF